VTGALVEQAGAGGSFLEELAREVVANAEVPDLGEMFVQQHRRACPEPSRRAEGGGWLLGGGGPDLSDPSERGPEPPASDGRHTPLNPAGTVQLTLF